ncbi:hypothetical protein PENSPDRAFT_605886 [Peniophora sp. CONT]|nr:hypothetical protein PENSPDRAFT_605886 [Peniophora sp. CONT]
MFRTLLVAAPLIAAASAFSDTHPILAWSSHETSVMDGAPRTGDILDHLLASDEICSFDAVVLAEQPGLHASDLRKLAPASPFASLLSQASASVQVPYTRRSVHALADTLASRCGARTIGVVPGASDMLFEPSSKHVISLYLPEIDGDAATRKAAVDTHCETLSAELATVAAAAPRHLVIYGGSPSTESNLARRQLSVSSIGEDVIQSPTVPAPVLQQAPTAAFASPTGGILARYQLLTPGLITALLIAFLVLLPALMFSISALSAIQSPLRVEAPKGYSAEGKKNQ